ncbi:FtsK/SpoIIIE family DNA translocase [Serpentinicella alkaliphila]|uniref:FtsK/SpoIIIE family DNA translocase n=1 Tax=Serpentinicella alkaliphila TaxID=1734049 RepID=UPI001FA9782D|nr:DNA translocase FtsK [Serpentinicella alkaliphila]
MPRKTKSKKKINTLKNFKHANEVYGICTIAFGLILLAAMQTRGAGQIGEWVRLLFMGLFSTVALIIPYIIVFLGILFFTNKSFSKVRNTIYFTMFFLCILVFKTLLDKTILDGLITLKLSELVSSSFAIGSEGIGGGLVGTLITSALVGLLGYYGSYIVVVATFIICTMLYTKTSLLQLLVNIKKILMKPIEMISFERKAKPKKETIKINIPSEPAETHINKVEQNIEEKIKILDYTDINSKASLVEAVEEPVLDAEELEEINEISTSKLQKQSSIQYILPETALLNQLEVTVNKDDRKNIQLKAKKLEDTLRNFGVQAKILQVNKGPTVTRFELQPDTGVKVSKIVNLSDDIALNLAAPAIRIEAPIPGKAAVGIEIPNDIVSMVTLREMIEQEAFSNSNLRLPFILGKDVSGSPIIGDIAQMPHLLIAGATGSGKSVCINTLILSILYRFTPESVRLLLIDPKVVELNQYNGVPHLLIPVVTDAKRATSALNWAVQEMIQRYKSFAENGVKDILGYNEKYKDNKMPYIVIIIDELADLMMVAPNDVEDAICRLAQMARAAGLHLIIATQRPSVDVITGIIKANIPSRIAFSVASQTDSRTILDMGGAEKLLGKGDMLYYPIGYNKPLRVQASFVSEKEVERVVTFIKEQLNPMYEEEVIDTISKNNTNMVNNEDIDELFDDALRVIVESNQASISMLQRRLKIGYNRAARLIDDMEARGYIGPHEGSKPRQVLIENVDIPSKEAR